MLQQLHHTKVLLTILRSPALNLCALGSEFGSRGLENLPGRMETRELTQRKDTAFSDEYSAPGTASGSVPLCPVCAGGQKA